MTGQPSLESDAAGHQDVGVAEEHVQVAVGVGLQQIAVLDLLAGELQALLGQVDARDQRVARARLHRKRAVGLGMPGLGLGVFEPAAVFSCPMIFAPALPRRSLDPVCSGCQWVLIRVCTCLAAGLPVHRIQQVRRSAPAVRRRPAAMPSGAVRRDHVGSGAGEHHQMVVEAVGR